MTYFLLKLRWFEKIEAMNISETDRTVPVQGYENKRCRVARPADRQATLRVHETTS